MSEEAKALTDEELAAELQARFKSSKQGLEMLNASGLARRASDFVDDSNGLGQGWAKTVMNMTATGLVGVLLFLAQNEGFKILRGLMEESKQQRSDFAASLESLRRERQEDRLVTFKHADEATAAMKEIARGLRALNKKTDEELDKNLSKDTEQRPIKKAGS